MNPQSAFAEHLTIINEHFPRFLSSMLRYCRNLKDASEQSKKPDFVREDARRFLSEGLVNLIYSYRYFPGLRVDNKDDFANASPLLNQDYFTRFKPLSYIGPALISDFEKYFNFKDLNDEEISVCSTLGLESKSPVSLFLGIKEFIDETNWETVNWSGLRAVFPKFREPFGFEELEFMLLEHLKSMPIRNKNELGEYVSRVILPHH
ncbi:MAG: hypothetical protein ACOCXG_00405 [Nanoarchaeota archaeon]